MTQSRQGNNGMAWSPDRLVEPAVITLVSAALAVAVSLESSGRMPPAPGGNDVALSCPVAPPDDPAGRLKPFAVPGYGTVYTL